MRITIKATGIEHTNAIDSYVTKSLKNLEKVLEPREKSVIARVDVGVTTKHRKAGEIFYAELTMHVKGKDVRAVATADSLYTAIDDMRDDVVREVTQYHDRLRAKVKSGARTMKRRMQKAS